MFLFFNGFHSPFWDSVFYWVTGKLFWIPFLLGLIFLSYVSVQWRTVFTLLFIGLVIALADQISVKLFKEVFERLRPCHNPVLEGLVHTINGHCGGKFGFVSSHAANSFALAVFSGLMFRTKYNFVMPAMLFWALLVSYSRVYVGVHYPMDILCGGILGTIIALLVYRLFKYLNRTLNLKLEAL